MSGHGWVTPNLDGSKARCGGPGLCSECSAEVLTPKPAPRGYTDREKSMSIALHKHGLVFFPRDTAVYGYVVFSITGTTREYDGRRFDSIDELEAFAAELRSDSDALDAARYATATAITMRGKPIRTTPYVGQMVHYVSHGTPVREDGSQAYPSVCRAAVVAAIHDELHHEQGACLVLCVLNPTGQFFKGAISPDQGIYRGGERTITIKPGEPTNPLPLIICDDKDFAPGTWHFIAHPEAP